MISITNLGVSKHYSAATWLLNLGMDNSITILTGNSEALFNAE